LDLQAKLTSTDVAAVLRKGDSMMEMEAAMNQCLMGYAQINILTMKPKLKFGVYNYRPLDVSESDKIFRSMIEHGIQRFMVENAIPLVVPSEWVDSSKLTDKVDSGMNLLKLMFTDEGSAQNEVIVAGGVTLQVRVREG
jgi:hypothetical protein